MNIQRWHVGQKIISSKKAHEDEIINYPLKLNATSFGRIFYLQVKLKILPQQPNVQKLHS